MDADELYRLAPEDFTAARDAAAKERKRAGDAEGAAELKALRRPSVAAWLLNRLAHDAPDLLGELLDLGPALADAQSGGDAAALRALGAQRRELVDAVTQAAVAASGRTVGPAVRAEVAATLEAALADPSSAQAVRSGRLVRALSYAGFGAVDLAGAVAGSSVPASQAAEQGGTGRRRAPVVEPDRRADERRAAIAAAEAAAQQAAGRLDDAVRACEHAERIRERTELAAQERAAEVARAVEELERARREHETAQDEVEQTAVAAEHALRAVVDAQADAERARDGLDELRRDA